jgi:hypothetical protein
MPSAAVFAAALIESGDQLASHFNGHVGAANVPGLVKSNSIADTNCIPNSDNAPIEQPTRLEKINMVALCQQ